MVVDSVVYLAVPGHKSAGVGRRNQLSLIYLKSAMNSVGTNQLQLVQTHEIFCKRINEYD